VNNLTLAQLQLVPHSITHLLTGVWSCQMRSGAPSRPPCVAVSALRRGAPMHRLLLRARSRLPHSLNAGRGSHAPPSSCWRTCATSAGTSASAHPARPAPEPFQNARLLQLLAGLQYEASRGCGNAQVRAPQQAQPAGQCACGQPQVCCPAAGSRRGALLRVCCAARSRAAWQFPARRLARAGGRHAASTLTASPAAPVKLLPPATHPGLCQPHRTRFARGLLYGAGFRGYGGLPVEQRAALLRRAQAAVAALARPPQLQAEGLASPAALPALAGAHGAQATARSRPAPHDVAQAASAASVPPARERSGAPPLAPPAPSSHLGHLRAPNLAQAQAQAPAAPHSPGFSTGRAAGSAGASAAAPARDLGRLTPVPAALATGAGANARSSGRLAAPLPPVLAEHVAAASAAAGAGAVHAAQPIAAHLAVRSPPQGEARSWAARPPADPTAPGTALHPGSSAAAGEPALDASGLTLGLGPGEAAAPAEEAAEAGARVGEDAEFAGGGAAEPCAPWLSAKPVTASAAPCPRPLGG